MTVPEAIVRRKSQQIATVDDTLDEGEAIVQMIAGNEQGVMTDEVCRAVGKSAQAIGSTFEKLKREGTLLGFAGLWLTKENFAAVSKKLELALSHMHEQDPTRLLHPREQATAKAGIKWSSKPLDRIVTHLTDTGVLRSHGTNIALASFKVRFSDKQQAMLDRVIAVLDKAGVSVPSPSEIALEISVPHQAVTEIIKIGVAAGEIVRIEEGINYSANALQGIVERLRQEFSGKQFSASEFRGHMETSRKYAIPILEYLDSKAVTKRMGDQRVVLD